VSQKKGSQKGSQCQPKRLNLRGGKSELTPKQSEVYRLRFIDGLTPPQISRVLNISSSAVYAHIANIKKKGFASKDFKGVENFDPTCQPTNPYGKVVKGLQFRLHAQHWVVKIAHVTAKYVARLQSVNAINIMGNNVMLHKNKLQIYSNVDFWSADPKKAFHDSLTYWSKFALRLESDLDIVLIKNRLQNWKLVNMHVAEVDNELANDYQVRGDKLQVYGRDGKLWALIDNSFNLRELETVSGVRSVDDMERVQGVFNDYREGSAPLPSDVWRLVAQSVKLHEESAAGIRSLVELMQPAKTEVKPVNWSEVSYIG